MIEAPQVRAARALIGWSQTQLADAAGVPVSIVERFETGAPDAIADEAIEKMRGALEAAGVAFIPKNGGGAGVRLRKGRASEYIGWDDLNASNDECGIMRSDAPSLSGKSPVPRSRAGVVERAWRFHTWGVSSTKPPDGAGCGTFQPK